MLVVAKKISYIYLHWEPGVACPQVQRTILAKKTSCESIRNFHKVKILSSFNLKSFSF